MTAETFLNTFGHLLDAPNGVTKLRELILQLAVQGRLVEQDPDDEPASELLLKLKRVTKIRAIEKEGQPYQLPSSWLWIHFGDVFDIQGGSQPPKNQFVASPQEGYVRLLQIRDFGPNPVPTYIPQNTVGRMCSEDDVMLARYGASVGKIFMGQNGAYNVALTKVIFNKKYIYNQYVFFLLQSTLFQNPLQSMSRSAQAGFNKGNIHPILLPLPPLEEQKRIVKKVDELMALVDTLENTQTEKARTRLKLSKASFAALANAQNASEFTQSWQRVGRHFAELVKTQEDVQTLRQTILQLAVQGKLTEQRGEDGDAREELELVKLEKISLVNNRSIPKVKLTEPLEQEELCFEVPPNWSWIRLNDVVLQITSGWSPQCSGNPKSGDDWGVLKVSAVTWDSFQPQENKALPKDKTPRPEHEVKTGDFLMSRANTLMLVGKSVIVEETPNRLMMSDKILRVRFSEYVEKRFFNLYNNGVFARDYYIQTASGTSSSMRNISRSQILNMPVPLPPLAEQKRIVAKVDSLMAVCDRLEALLSQQQSTAERLVGAVVQGLAA